LSKIDVLCATFYFMKLAEVAEWQSRNPG